MDCSPENQEIKALPQGKSKELIVIPQASKAGQQKQFCKPVGL
jgi:hypothetical protein